jgi:hypothetical protein
VLETRGCDISRRPFFFLVFSFPNFLLTSTFFPSQAPTAPPLAYSSPRAPAATGAAPDFGDAYLEDVKEDVADEEEERDLEADAGANDITHEKREVSVPANALVPAQKNAGFPPQA